MGACEATVFRLPARGRLALELLPEHAIGGRERLAELGRRLAARLGEIRTAAAGPAPSAQEAITSA